MFTAVINGHIFSLIMFVLIISMDYLTRNPINLEETKKWRIYFPMNG